MAKIHFAPGQNYDCVMCAKGCVEKWDIVVDPRAEKAVRGSLLELRVIQNHGGPPFDVFPETPRGRVVARIEDTRPPSGGRGGELGEPARGATNSCVFLGADKLCDIHREMGIEAKPVPCRQFPFTVKATPDGLFVGVTFFCTSAQQNSGRPLEAHEEEVKEILKTIEIPRIGFRPLRVAHEVSMDWETYKHFEQLVSRGVDSVGPLLAFSQAFRCLSQAVQDLGEGLITVEKLNGLWRASGPVDLAQDPVLGFQMEFFLGALIGVIEVGNNPEHQVICQSFLDGGVYDLKRLGARINFSETRRLRYQIENNFDVEIRRYFQSLLFRKFLASSRPILDNAILGYLLLRLLIVYTSLFAQRRGVAPEMQDYFKALDLVEADVVTHAKGLEKLVSAYSQATHNFLNLT